MPSLQHPKNVVDAKRDLPFRITKLDIKIGNNQDPGSCAAALACKRKVHAREVRVYLTRAYVRMGRGPWQRYSTPRNLRTEIVAFDRGGHFMPGEYMLHAPLAASLKLGYRAVPTGKKGSSARRHPKMVANVRSKAPRYLQAS